jgi:hypothetical protein
MKTNLKHVFFDGKAAAFFPGVYKSRIFVIIEDVYLYAKKRANSAFMPQTGFSIGKGL